MIYYLGLGSNLGDRNDYIEQAKNIIANAKQINVLRSSETIQTKPYGKLDQPDFLNAVIEIKTTLSSQELLEFCLKTEAKLDRVRLEKWGARTIDIDILLAEEIVDEKNLTIPHPELYKRKFVLRSLVELCPSYLHPKLNKTVQQLYSELI